MNTPTPEIRKALYGKLIEVLPTIGVAQDHVAWPNVSFEPEPPELYIAVFCLFSETTIASLGTDGFEKLGGVFQISIRGVLNTGEGEMEEIARTLVDSFRSGSRLAVADGAELIFTKTYTQSMIIIDNRPQIDVSAHWNCYAAKGE